MSDNPRALRRDHVREHVESREVEEALLDHRSEGWALELLHDPSEQPKP